MRKKKDDGLSSMIDEVLHDVQPSGGRKVVDIITFCEDPKYLNFGGQTPPINLWPMQKIVLKMFYRGTRGNEHIELDEGELDILRNIAKHEDLDYESEKNGFQQVIDKYYRRSPLRTLQLIMGRRSSKTFMVSLVAAYEAYKLLETGNPQKFYGLPPGKPIAIINVAVSESQAYDPLFLEIQARVTNSPYFSDKISPASKKGEMFLLTDADKDEIIRRKTEGINLSVEGSVVLMSGHSNSRSIRGKAAIAILFDEFAHFMNSAGRQSGDEVYTALAPSTQQFGNDGKLVLLSDPRDKSGIFWKLFEMSQEVKDGVYPNDNILALQLPTWVMNPNPNFAKEKLEREEKPKDPIAFLNSYAARFTGELGMKMFDAARLEACINTSYREPPFGDLKYPYYIHLDPATTSHNYALAMVHAIHVRNPRGDSRTRIVTDLLKLWRPSGFGPIDISEIEKFIIALSRKFNVAMVSFDSFQSAQTIQRLKAVGIRAVETPFSPIYTSEVYGELRNMVHQGDISLPTNEQLLGEMRELLYKIHGHHIKPMVNVRSMDFHTDDCVDALAGAAYQAMYSKVRASLPRSAVAYMPVGVWAGGMGR